MEQGEVRETLCTACGQTNIRYEGGWRGFWLRPRQSYLCTFCRANLRSGEFRWSDWPGRIVMALVFYGGYALIFGGLWLLVLLAVLGIMDRIEPQSLTDSVLRALSLIVAAGIGVAVCEWRRRKGTLLGGRRSRSD